MSMLKSHSHALSLSHSLTLDMLNNFCFHVHAQKSLFIGENTLTLSHSLTLNMLNNFCFHVHAQKSLLIGENVNAFLLPLPHPVSLEFIKTRLLKKTF